MANLHLSAVCAPSAAPCVHPASSSDYGPLHILKTSNQDLQRLVLQAGNLLFLLSRLTELEVADGHDGEEGEEDHLADGGPVEGRVPGHREQPVRLPGDGQAEEAGVAVYVRELRDEAERLDELPAEVLAGVAEHGEAEIVVEGEEHVAEHPPGRLRGRGGRARRVDAHGEPHVDGGDHEEEVQDEVVEEGRAVDRLHVPDLLYQDGEHADECLLLGGVAVDQGEVDVHELLAREETQQPDPWSWCAALSSSPPSTCSSLQAEGQAHTDTMGKEGGGLGSNQILPHPDLLKKIIKFAKIFLSLILLPPFFSKECKKHFNH